MTDSDNLKNAGIRLREELESRGVNLGKPRKPNSLDKTDTDGWSVEIGRVSSPNLIVELWLDRWPGLRKRCFCACFYSSKEANIETLIDWLPKKLRPVKTFSDEHWTHNDNDFRFLKKPLAQNLLNKPIAEKFDNTKAYFLNFYDKGDSPARGKTTLDVSSAASFIQGVVLALNSLNESAADSAELPEGKLSTVIHLRRERNPKVRRMLLASRRKLGLVCESCKMSRPKLRIDLQEALFEAHHATPLSNTRERKTRLADLNLLCASCHRLIHRVMATNKRAVSVKEIEQLLVSS